MTQSPDLPTTPEDVAEVLTLGVLEQVQARMADLTASLGRLGPPGGVLVDHDRIRAEAIAAMMAMCVLQLDHRLSPADLHRVHRGLEDQFDQLSPTLATQLWWYYFRLRGASGEARLRALSRAFRARCYQLRPEGLAMADPAGLSLAALLVPQGAEALAGDVGRLLRQAASP